MMPENRPAIPAELRRQVLVEAGHRCAVPTCRQWPVEIEHIDDWAVVKEHKFENLIALCPTCHARKGNGSGQIDRKSLRAYKAGLSLLRSLYSDVERRILENYAKTRSYRPVVVPGSLEFMVSRLVDDGFIVPIKGTAVFVESVSIQIDGDQWDMDTPSHVMYALTAEGRHFVEQTVLAQDEES